MNSEKESVHDSNINNELVVGGDQTIAIIDYVLEHGKLIVGQSTIFSVMFIDPTTKHMFTTNNGYKMAIVGGDTLNLVCNMCNVWLCICNMFRQ